MKFQKKKKRPAPFYGKTTREKMAEQMWMECGKALASGNSTEVITTAHSIAVNPVKK